MWQRERRRRRLRRHWYLEGPGPARRRDPSGDGFPEREPERSGKHPGEYPGRGCPRQPVPLSEAEVLPRGLMVGPLKELILQDDGGQEAALSDGIPRGEWGFHLELGRRGNRFRGERSKTGPPTPSPFSQEKDGRRSLESPLLRPLVHSCPASIESPATGAEIPPMWNMESRKSFACQARGGSRSLNGRRNPLQGTSTVEFPAPGP